MSREALRRRTDESVPSDSLLVGSWSWTVLSDGEETAGGVTVPADRRDVPLVICDSFRKWPTLEPKPERRSTSSPRRRRFFIVHHDGRTRRRPGAVWATQPARPPQAGGVSPRSGRTPLFNLEPPTETFLKVPPTEPDGFIATRRPHGVRLKSSSRLKLTQKNNRLLRVSSPLSPFISRQGPDRR